MLVAPEAVTVRARVAQTVNRIRRLEVQTGGRFEMSRHIECSVTVGALFNHAIQNRPSRL